MYLFVLFLSVSLKHLKPQSRIINPITHNSFRHCRVQFCWTTFLEIAFNTDDLRGFKGDEKKT